LLEVRAVRERSVRQDALRPLANAEPVTRNGKAPLAEPLLDGFETGSPEWFAVQREIIDSRPLVRRTYRQWYATMLTDVASAPELEGASVLEIGSGPGYIKTMDSTVITSDIAPGNVDMVIDAQALPFENSSLRAILLTHVFHHIPDVRKFLREASRTLVPGGVISMIDVAHTPLARFLFGRFDTEDYESKRTEWELDLQRPLGGANQALTWMVFQRDRKTFDVSFPEFRVECIERLPWLGYMLSGGVTRRNLVPHQIAPAVGGLDRVAEVLNPLCSLHWHIRIRKQR
jgi:SAM-dependent methyltransferase